MQILKTLMLTTAILASAQSALAGSPYAFQSDAELAMVEPEKKPKAGSLTAGDYDDVLNPELYKAYLDKMLQGPLAGKDLPYMNADQRINIKVVDNLGQAFPFADLSVKKGNGEEMFPLRTASNGMSYIYPDYDGLDAGTVVTAVASNNMPIDKTLSQDLIENGGDITFAMQSNRKPVDKLDLLLTIDATGSMADEMRYLQAELDAIITRVEANHPAIDIRQGLIVYRDKGDDYVVKAFPFTENTEDFKTKLNLQKATGGGDMPEAMHSAMAEGLNFEWRDEALKVNFLVADAPPHDKHIAETWDAGMKSRQHGIHIIPIAGSGVDLTAEFLMRGMSQITSGRYVFLTDDSGIGNPHAEPSVDCYVVTRLDDLMTRILNGLISGTREEPKIHEIIRSVGQYNAGKCEIESPQ